ncbi:MAG: hypothetical protein ACK5Q7_16960, partial [Cyanobacteriota bacterium]
MKAILPWPQQEAAMKWMVGVHEAPKTCIPHQSFSSMGGGATHQIIISCKAVESQGFQPRLTSSVVFR